MKINKRVLICIFTSIAIAGCGSTGAAKNKGVEKSFLDGRINSIDPEKTVESSFKRQPSAYMMKETPEFMTLSQVDDSDMLGKISPLSYSISMSDDKTNKSSPFYRNVVRFRTLNTRLYRGGDKWSHEAGVEKNPSIESWLLEDAMRRVSQEVSNKTAWRPDLIGGRLTDDGKKLAFQSGYTGMISFIEYMLERGIEKREAEIVAAKCFAGTFFDFKFKSDLPKSERQFWIEYAKDFKNHFAQYKPVNVRSCDYVRENLKVDGTSIFVGMERYNTRQVKMTTEETVEINDPALDVELWHHLVSAELYPNHARVILEGPFSGLLFPEKANIKLGFLKLRRDGDDIALFNDPTANVRDKKMTASHIAYQWFGDKEFKSEFLDQNHLIEWDKRERATIKLGGSMHSSSLRCRNNPNLVNTVINGQYFNKYYDCSIHLGNNRYAKALGHLSSFRPTRAAGNSLSSAGPSGFIKFDGTVVASDTLMGDDCDGALYKEACESQQPVHIDDYVEKFLLNSVTPYTGISYTRVKTGKVEGVVYYWGRKFIYDLTDIASWYKRRMQHAIEEAQPDLSPIDVVDKAAMLTGVNSQ